MHSRIFLVASLLAAPTSASAQQSAWLTRLGQDTTAVERAERILPAKTLL